MSQQVRGIYLFNDNQTKSCIQKQKYLFLSIYLYFNQLKLSNLSNQFIKKQLKEYNNTIVTYAIKNMREQSVKMISIRFISKPKYFQVLNQFKNKMKIPYK
ncbi:hypothetical protein ABPG72_019029 [Tetrahymena utriculariae]